MHRVFISYHHANDQKYKDDLLGYNSLHRIFEDQSVDTGDIDDNLDDDTIREKIRDEYLRDTSVTILLVGTETKYRKHVDWEIYSSMYDGKRNKKSGIVVITLPTTQCGFFQAAHEGEKENVYPDTTSWAAINERTEFKNRFPYLPERIIDNLLEPKARISVTNWDKINEKTLAFLIEAAYKDRQACEYDLSRPMRRVNS
ncbi:MAG: TIR domain-containing protein [Fibrobacteres bacterium]|nr:TIR domain-containing protein [Fibrobacterota bacterium]